MQTFTNAVKQTNNKNNINTTTMKQTDIKRLEKVADHLRKAQELLDQTYDSLENQPTAYYYFGTSGARQTHTGMVGQMLKEVAEQRQYIEGKVKAFKEEIAQQ